MQPLLIELVEKFIDDQAFLTPVGIVAALAADEVALVKCVARLALQDSKFRPTAAVESFVRCR